MSQIRRTAVENMDAETVLCIGKWVGGNLQDLNYQLWNDRHKCKGFPIPQYPLLLGVPVSIKCLSLHGQLSLIQTELESQWEAKCERMLASAKEQHLRQYREVCEQRDSQQQKIIQLEEKVNFHPLLMKHSKKKNSWYTHSLLHYIP